MTTYKNINLLWILLFVGCILITLFSSCATSTPETPTLKPTEIPIETIIPPSPIPEPTGTYPANIKIIERAEVTFDGESCIYDGPEVIQEGKVVFSLNNNSEATVIFNIYAHEESYTWQDVLEYYGEPGSTYGWPEWYIDIESSFIFSEPNAREFPLNPGLHSIVVMVTFDSGPSMYPCAPLDVWATP